jgi:hypothetical protein
MDNPDNSMICVRYEQKEKDLFLIRKIREFMLHFLMRGPYKTDDFFYCHKERSFRAEELKVKMKSLKIALELIYALLKNDVVNPRFVDHTLHICQAAILGMMRLSTEQENEIPPIVKSMWVYILCWLAKDIVINQNNRRMRNGLRAIEVKAINILRALQEFRTNLQVTRLLQLFYANYGSNQQAHVTSTQSMETLLQFQDIFKLH